MGANPVNAWDMKLALIPEATFGTTPAPADAAAYAALMVEAIAADLGLVQVGQVRPKQDRGIGRAMQDGWVEGRVAPIDWQIQLAVKSRSANDGTPLENALYEGAGLNSQDAGSTWTLTPSATPIESSHFAPFTAQRWLGSGAALYQSEKLRGCVTKSLRWEGGDKELLLTASGAGVGKYTQGSIDSATVADNSTTSITISAADSYRIDLGYYLWESEIVLVTACTRGGTSMTVTRGVLGSTAAAHSAQPMYPYKPTPSFSGAPISEAAATVTIDSVATRCIGWSAELQTGMDLLPGETGSAYVQGAKYGRYEMTYNVRLVLSQTQLLLLGKATARPNLAVSIAQGSGTGGLVTFASSNCEVVAFKVPDTANDNAVCDIAFRVRDSVATGNDAFTITFSGS